jgi:Tol biopolymer transport system component
MLARVQVPATVYRAKLSNSLSLNEKEPPFKRASTTRMHTLAHHLSIAATLLLAACATTKSAGSVPSIDMTPWHGAYFGLKAGSNVSLFAKGLVSTKQQELNAAFSPQGDEFFFTLADASRSFYALLHTKMKADGTWTEPQVASFSGEHADADPTFSPDGKRLYFISRRPREGLAAQKKNFNVWYVERAESGWGQPVDVGSDVNSEDEEFYVSVTRDGVIYTSRNGKIVRAVPQAGGKYQVEFLPSEVNQEKTVSADAYVAADESYLIFTSFFGRSDAPGSGDLYISFRVDGKWQPAQLLKNGVNTDSVEYCPMVSPDGKYFFFTSYRLSPEAKPVGRRNLETILQDFEKVENGMGNVYWMSAEFIEAMRPKR